MSPNNVVIMDFTGVYQSQPFMFELKQEANWMDCSGMSGTDCYCDDESFKELTQKTQAFGFAGIHFFDNGNYHYLSKIWTDKIKEKFSLVVFDHHPDMQPPRFQGILSCGGWLKDVLEQNDYLQDVLLIGVSDNLIEELASEESCEFHKFKKRVHFIRESEIVRYRESNSFATIVEQLQDFCSASHSLYISIDKDALSKEVASTNWDQGSLDKESFLTLINAILKFRILGIDICGERSQNDILESTHADERNNDINKAIYQALL
ncbi:MAG: arginase family protein [Fibrobacter sp.]|nr:arginase family protein [Fibrobacter sp.]